MSISVLLSPAPGWYPDPAGIATYRWWDGDTWTEGTHAGLEIAPELVEPVAPATPEPASALVAEFGSTLKPSIRLYADEQSTPAVGSPAAPSSFAEPAPADPASATASSSASTSAASAPAASSFDGSPFDGSSFDGSSFTASSFTASPFDATSFGDAPTPSLLFSDPTPDAALGAEPAFLAALTHAPIADLPTRTVTPRAVAPAKTRWSSMLAAFPVVYPIVVGMIVALGYAGGAASNIVALIVIAGIAAVGGLVPAWIFADNDRRELVARGYAPAPSIAWMLVLPPFAYLLARRRVVGPSY